MPNWQDSIREYWNSFSLNWCSISWGMAWWLPHLLTPSREKHRGATFAANLRLHRIPVSSYPVMVPLCDWMSSGSRATSPQPCGKQTIEKHFNSIIVSSIKWAWKPKKSTTWWIGHLVSTLGWNLDLPKNHYIQAGGIRPLSHNEKEKKVRTKQ